MDTEIKSRLKRLHFKMAPVDFVSLFMFSPILSYN